MSSSSRPTPTSVSLSNAVFFLTVPLEFSPLLDDRTLARLRQALQHNLDAHFAARGSNQFLLEAAAMPPKPILTAGFAVRMRWSDWFAVLSPEGRPILLQITADGAPARPASPSPSLGRSSSCSSMRSDVPSLASVSTAATGSSLCSSPSSPAPAPCVDIYGVTVNAADPGATIVRRPRRQRGGVKQKQRGIHIDKSKLDITAYDGGVTGVLTGGVMLGRRLRPAA